MDPEALYDSVKPVVWVLMIEGIYKEEGERQESKHTATATAFAVKEGDLLMSCALGTWLNWSKRTIKARPLCSDDVYDAVVVDTKKDCALCFLRVEGAKNMPFGSFGSGKLEVGEMVMVVGHPWEFVGSGLVGQVVYPCVPKPPFSLGETLTCKRYESDVSQRTPCVRLMGHLWNKDSIQKKKNDWNFKVNPDLIKNLRARIPVIQCSGLVCKSGSAGAPMFNVKGEIVGMHFMYYSGYDIALHVAVLQRVLDIVNTTVGGPTKGEMGHSSAKKKGSKTGSKRKRV